MESPPPRLSQGILSYLFFLTQVLLRPLLSTVAVNVTLAETLETFQRISVGS